MAKGSIKDRFLLQLKLLPFMGDRTSLRKEVSPKPSVFAPLSYVLKQTIKQYISIIIVPPGFIFSTRLSITVKLQLHEVTCEYRSEGEKKELM